MVAGRWRGTLSLLLRRTVRLQPNTQRGTNDESTINNSIFFYFFSFSAYLPSLHRLYGPCNPPVLSRLLCLLLSQ